MTKTLADVMTPDPTTCPATVTVAEAARTMRDLGIGDVLVEKNGAICGIVTDRDIVVRALADIDHDPREVRLGDICSRELTTLSPTDSVDEAVQLMRTKALRRLPVCEDGKPVGIVSIGDLAVERDPTSALASISSAPSNN